MSTHRHKCKSMRNRSRSRPAIPDDNCDILWPGLPKFPAGMRQVCRFLGKGAHDGAGALEVERGQVADVGWEAHG